MAKSPVRTVICPNPCNHASLDPRDAHMGPGAINIEPAESRLTWLQRSIDNFSQRRAFHVNQDNQYRKHERAWTIGGEQIMHSLLQS